MIPREERLEGKAGTARSQEGARQHSKEAISVRKCQLNPCSKLNVGAPPNSLLKP